MGKLALGLTLITIVITVFFLAIMTAFGVIEAKDLRKLKRVVVPSNEKKIRKEDREKPPYL